MNLSTWKERSKEPKVRIGVLVLLMITLSFGLGYLLGRDSNPAPIVIEKNSSN